VSSDNADAMLRRLIDEAQRALRTQDPAGRADIISSSIQPYAGWALRWAIDDCRRGGMAWQTIAGLLNRSYPSLLRQFEAGGPVYTARAAHSAGTRNYDGQTPLRRAATALAQQMAGLGMHRPDSVTWTHLHEPVDQLASAQCITDDPEPLLRAAQTVLGIADRVRLTAEAQPSISKAERAIWPIIDELKACYERDRPQIEAAHQALSRPLVDAPGFTRELT
jgi:hypothetical protein